MNKNITMDSIAEECGVSKMTVSRVLDPRFKGKISESTRKKILDSVNKYNYKSNISASRLKRKKLDTITLIMGTRATSGPQATPDFDLHYEMISWGIMKAVVQEARKYCYDVKIEIMLSENDYTSICSNLTSEMTDGVLLSTSPGLAQDFILKHLRKEKLPFAAVLPRNSQENIVSGNTVIIDRVPGLKAALEHLYAKGHRKIAFSGSDMQISSIEQKSFYSEYMNEKNIYDKKLFYSVNTLLELRKLICGFKKEFPFTALICHNDSMADMAVRELSFLGVEIPDRIAVIGFDGNPVYQGKGRSNISTIRMPYSEAMTTATEMLIRDISSNTISAKNIEILETSFIAGATS